MKKSVIWETKERSTHELVDKKIIMTGFRDDVFQEMVEMGQISTEEARTHTRRNIISRAVGLELTVEVDQGQHQLLNGDKLLICSDGLHDMITSDIEIANIIQKANKLETAVADLVKEALHNGGLDNITVVLVEID